MSPNFKTPILFIIFNRPESTQKVFNEIRKIKPQKFYITADGPRENMPEDLQRCEKTRNIIKQIDWDCEVFTNFRDKNLGCKIAVSSGINWFFENVEEGLILEDDTLPHPTFFPFCEKLLEKYRYDNRIMMISGDNFQFGKKRTDYSYYFSRYTLIWGWATWRRAWQYYDVNIKLWTEIKNGDWLYDIFSTKNETIYWSYIFEKIYIGEINTWDYQWSFACWIQNGFTIIPNVNLVSNIGFGDLATHTIKKSNYANIPIEEMKFDLKYPPYVICDILADRFYFNDQYRMSSLPVLIIKKIKKIYNKFLEKIKMEN
ncbi:glycosyltransferase family 2 protein [Candidatus Poribacteria bacterium]|nr:glycosyltransferase family 2 protein [Candidatus Poribacteria bacterium]